MSPAASRFRDVFGFDCPPKPLFGSVPNALRFDLGGDVSAARPISRFLAAFRRASAIAEAALGQSERLALLVVAYGDGARPRRELGKLAKAGLSAGDWVLTATHPPDEFFETQRHVFIADASRPGAREEVLWLALASDLGIRPAAPGLDLYLADLEAGLLLHPYDDRGLDVAATQPPALEALGAKFGDWLLG